MTPRRAARARLGAADTAAAADAAPAGLSATAAWRGWTRPGRPTELQLRVAATQRSTLRLEASDGRVTLGRSLALEPGRPQTLHWPGPGPGPWRLTLSDPAAGRVVATAELRTTESESPLLGLALADAARAAALPAWPGFHAVPLVADDLPRHAATQAAFDALLLDAEVLRRLDERQLSALLDHAAGCGRVAVIGADEALAEALAGAAGCGGRFLVVADGAQPPDAVLRRLRDTLDTPAPPPLSPTALGTLAPPDTVGWARVALALASTLAVAALALAFSAAPALVLGLPALLATALAAGLHTGTPPARAAVWSEGDAALRSAGSVLRLQATGTARGLQVLAVPAALGASLAPCPAAGGAALPWQFELDAGGAVRVAQGPTRLFAVRALCGSTRFPIDRAVERLVGEGDAGSVRVRNAGARGWPAGWWLDDTGNRPLPALAAGAQAVLPEPAVTAPPPEATRALQLAASRRTPGAGAALWPLDLSGVDGLPEARGGWLLLEAAR